MRLLFLLPAISAIAAALPAQEAVSQEDLIARRDKKLASTFLKQADWITDYDAARAAAKKSGELIFAYFTRSFAP